MTTHDTAAVPLKHTPLYAQHVALGARMVEFGGWEMPVQYTGIIEEHRAVRTRAGLFDVSHMGEFKIEGPGAQAFLQYLLPNDIARLAVQQALYNPLCTSAGTVIDDLLVYHLAEAQYMAVVNASNIEKDFAWFQEQARAFPDVILSNQSETTALLALQGPAAQAILQSLTTTDLSTIRYYRFAPGQISGIDCLISRTGYTGEDGFELYFASIEAPRLWEALLSAGKEHGLLPAGLGARDTLRLEAGLALYGHELDEQTNPLEAGLKWTVKFEKGDFIGRAALLPIQEQGPARKLIGIEMLERGIPRGGYLIYADEQAIGSLTSGAPSPTLNKNIGLGYVKSAYAKPGQAVQIEIRGRRLAAQIVGLPFYKRPK